MPDRPAQRRIAPPERSDRYRSIGGPVAGEQFRAACVLGETFIMEETDVLIAGGGLAGLCCAIQLRKLGYMVTLIESNRYPHHKVCGEFLSLEVMPYLDFLDANPCGLSPVRIGELECSLPGGRKFRSRLPLGGIGISRFTLDDFLYRKAVDMGCRVQIDQVTDLREHGGRFRAETRSGKPYQARIALGAFGKRSLLDRKKNRAFLRRQADWMAIKGHYRTAAYPDGLVGLHFFEGGYCGVSMVEGDVLNVCYLVKQATFRPYKNIDSHRKAVLYENPALKQLLQQSEPVLEKPLSISQISFAPKRPVEDHILMLGDSSRLLHPFSGNGMSAAMLSANLAAGLLHRFLKEELNLEELENLYGRQWRQAFGSRVRSGALLANFIHRPMGRAVLANLIARFPAILSGLIRNTQGTPFSPSTTDGG